MAKTPKKRQFIERSSHSHKTPHPPIEKSPSKAKKAPQKLSIPAKSVPDETPSATPVVAQQVPAIKLATVKKHQFKIGQPHIQNTIQKKAEMVDSQKRDDATMRDLTQSETVHMPETSLNGQYNTWNVSEEKTLRVTSVDSPNASSMAIKGNYKFWEQSRLRKILEFNFIRKQSVPVRVGLAILVLLPTILLIIQLFQAIIVYNQVRSALQRVHNIRALLAENTDKSQGPFAITKLRKVQQEMDAAHAEFTTLNRTLQIDFSVQMASGLFPEQVSSARALSRIGIEATEIGQEIMKSLLVLAPSLQGHLLADDENPLVTEQTLQELRKNLDFALPRIKIMEEQSRNISLDSLPVSEDQRALLSVVVQTLPQVRMELEETRGLDQVIGWLLGVNGTRTLLIQTIDRSEIRPTGGFTGQFAEITIKGGRIGKFELQDIGPLEKNNPNAKSNGQLPPAPYTWWPIPNWGLRDSNLSADFPTSAQLAINTYDFEFDKKVDGVVVFSPFLISRILAAIGPIYMPEYKETITAQNLEDRLHYYQLDNRGIDKSIKLAGLQQEWQRDNVGTTNKARKIFTKKVADILMDRIRKATPEQYIALAREMLNDLKTKDLQMYVSNPQLQQLIGKYGSTSSIDRSNAYDGLFVVQANVNANKASQYVNTTIKDTVQLDTKGGATHTLRITFDYTQAGPIYGYDSYRNYLRIYAPPKARLLWSNGFDQGYEKPFCGGEYGVPCPNSGDVYRNGTLICPPKLALPGVITTARNTGDYTNHPLNKIGPATDTTSDETGRSMFGGWVWFPKNCNMTISLSYYVPPTSDSTQPNSTSTQPNTTAQPNSTSTQPYKLMVQRQAGSQNTLDLTILPPPGTCTPPGLYYHGVMSTEDKMFTLPRRPSASCPDHNKLPA